MFIGELQTPPRKKRKRVGRGPGSGSGKTAGRGENGQKSRSGYKSRPWFEGGQMPLQRRVPKRGFFSRNKKHFQLVKIEGLAKFSDGQTVNAEALKEAGLIKKTDRLIKILGDGDLKAKLIVQADAFTKSAMEKIAQAGGEAVVRTSENAQ
ncbi:MAG: 50S ribosomal protein L15 [Candidatus Hinthialibacter antarcticus]|nr:50S ribosomal protein L15 [Candidatus Hinthialibacter antarcticus]